MLELANDPLDNALGVRTTWRGSLQLDAQIVDSCRGHVVRHELRAAVLHDHGRNSADWPAVLVDVDSEWLEALVASSEADQENLLELLQDGAFAVT